jgi:hypothetical protein
MKKRQQFGLDRHSNGRAFATKKYPTFGRGVYSESNPPSSVTSSPFYWWFKFLQLNDQYAKAVHSKRTKVKREVVADFGDVRHVDFKTWWNSHSHLFAEPLSTYKMYIPKDASEIAPFDDADVINLVVPLNWSNVGIKRRFSQIVDALVAKTPKGARAHKVSDAKYRLGRKWSPVGLKHAYGVYVARQQALQKEQETGERTYWADIGILADLPSARGAKLRDKSANNIEIRTNLTIQAVRNYKLAESFIAASATCTFPSPISRPKQRNLSDQANKVGLVHKVK